MKSAILANNARYEQEVEHLLSDLGSHDDALLNRKPAKGGWSAMQTMHHLILSEEGSLRYAQKKMNAPLEELGNAGIGSAWRAFLLWVSLTLPIKFKAPKGIDTEFLPENATFAETTARWRQIRAQWRAFLESLPEAYTRKTVYKHPRAGRLSWGGLIGFFRTHLRRHRKQMGRAILVARE